MKRLTVPNQKQESRKGNNEKKIAFSATGSFFTFYLD